MKKERLVRDVKSIIAMMNNFKKAQDNKNIETDRILYRMDLERPFALREKICMLGADKEHYKDKDHSL